MNSFQNKLRGGYYTPELISKFLTNWAIRSPEDKILEPSCGDGNILVESYKVLKNYGASGNSDKKLIGVEYFQQEAEKAEKRLLNLDGNLDLAEIVVGDFFEYYVKKLNFDKSFDVVVGNPPFIRYQNFPEEQKSIALELMRKNGLRPNRLTNAWLAFLVCSTLVLNKNGRLAMVIPAELFQVNYAAEVRKYLSDYFKRIFIITFKKLIFKEVQQEVVLLLAEKNSSNLEGINVIEVDDIAELSGLQLKEINENNLKPIDHNKDKWTKYFLDKDEILLLKHIKNHPQIVDSGDIFEVDVGIVTGQNSFFVMGGKDLKKYGLEESCHKIVTRSNQLRGLIFSEGDFNQNVEKNLPSFLFYPQDETEKPFSDSIQKYILDGEKKEVHKGYKCSNRKQWYKVPSVWRPDAFMLRQVHEYPKLVTNSTTASCTDTLHRVRFKNGYSPTQIANLFLNSLTFSFAEITGRSYGGGVLTFEPSEAEKLPLPLVKNDFADIGEIDRLLREGNIHEILKINDEKILKKELGFSAKDIKMLNSIWTKLKNRRIGRNHSA